MMKQYLALSLIFASSIAVSAPFLVSAPYPPTVPQPDTATMTINGGAPVTCVVESVTGGKRPKCDLGSITTPGSYTLIMTVSVAGGLSPSPCQTPCTNTSGSTASSAPFTYRLVTDPVSGPTLTVAP